MLKIRRMTLNDVSYVHQIEQVCSTIPWSYEAFYHEITNNDNAVYFVIQFRHELIGYVGMWCVIDEAHLTNIAIRPTHQGKKIGTKAMKFLQNYAKMKGMKAMTLEVRASNVIAQKLYYHLGFEMSGVRKRYYQDNSEDAYLMWATL